MTLRRLLLSLLAIALAAPSATPAHAQDDAEMEFSLEDTGTAPPEDGPPSETMNQALRAYQDQNYAEAAKLFQSIVYEETEDAPAKRQQAQFFLAKSLYHLRFYQSSLAILDEITQLGGGHLYFDESLQWLVQLASVLPEPANVVERIGRYPAEDLEQFNTGDTVPLYHQLLYLSGRYRYSASQFEEAVALFDRIPNTSEYYVDAQFYRGIAFVRRRQARSAIEAFTNIKDIIEAGDAVGVDDEARMLNLAKLSLARVYYAAANRIDPVSREYTVAPELRGQLIGQAVELWNSIDQASEYWLDSVFESAWAFFMVDQFSRSLGNIHTLFSPFFEDAFYPEGIVLKAVVFFYHCQWDNARAMVGIFHERYDGVQDALAETLNRFDDPNAFYQFLLDVRAGEADLPDSIRGIVSGALSDRTLLAHVEYVRVMEEESGRLDAMPEDFRNSSVGERIFQDIDLARSFAVDQAGNLARGRYNRLIDELGELTTQIDTVDLEVSTAMREGIAQAIREQNAERTESGGGDVVVDEEHQRWPFDGEYWRDELGFYRQQVTNQCGR